MTWIGLNSTGHINWVKEKRGINLSQYVLFIK